MSTKLHRPPSLKNALINMILDGRTGAGKTHFIGTMQECEETSPVLVLNFNGGMLTLAHPDHPAFQDVMVVEPSTFPEVQEIYDGLYEGSKKYRKYRSVAVDTLGDEQRDISLNSILEEIGDEGQYTDLGKDKPPDRRDWNVTGHQMRKFIRAIRNLSYHPDPALRRHVIMTAHLRLDEPTGMTVPNISGQVGVEAGGYVDILGHLARRTMKSGRKARYLYLEDHEDEHGVEYMAKTRIPQLGRGIWDPTMQKLVDLWSATKVESE